MDPLTQLIEMPELHGGMRIGSLLLARLLPMMVMTPVFGGQTMPRRLRFGIAIAFTAGLLPPFFPLFAKPIPLNDYVILLAKEAVVGLILAFFVQILFETVAAVGGIVDLARGATLANVFDPLTQDQQSILSALFTQFAIVLFISIGGMQLLFHGIAESFVLIPPLKFVSLNVLGPQSAATPIELLSLLFLLAVKMGAPAVVVLFMTDLGLGVINRVSPQIQVFFLGMTAKGSIGITIVLIGMGLFTDLVISHFAGILSAIHNWARAVGT
jgi:type III secretion protein SpaR/YscT/HrcT